MEIASQQNFILLGDPRTSEYNLLIAFTHNM